ncbi:histidine phosphatase family protein [Pseudorhodoferax sp.]|uniref:histidine phosphatase family protein n=1 Tax=Pseudorhodoferax sp. TaxID=1993553 RepID=UPI002DD61B27|nr:histidine phosphatase family protein [Pseudorhodoferax sp.]
MSGITRFVVIRHGETDWNRQGRFQGQIDVPLNAAGLAQAQRLGERLAAEPADVLVASDLQRTRQTASPLVQAWRIDAEWLPMLREQAFGVLEGLDVPTIEREHPALWAGWIEHKAGFALPGGESVRQFHDRVMQAFATLAMAHAGRTVAVVTHGGVLDMLWRSARGEPLDGRRSCDIPNTGINRLHWRNGRLAIDQWADAAHLEGLPPLAVV